MQDLSSMSRDELLKLRQEIDMALKKLDERRRKEALAAADRAAREYGFTLADLTGAKPPRSRGAVAPKYRNPANPAQTWSGHGRRPGWFTAAVESGVKPEDMEIGGS